MRTKQEVLDKIESMRSKYLRDRKERFLSKRPINCRHNISCRLKGKGSVGVCTNPIIQAKMGDKRFFVCNDDETAEKCGLFSCRSTHESVDMDFNKVISSPVMCGNEYPKLAVLLWFLQEGVVRKSRFWRFRSSFICVVSSFAKLITLKWW